MPGIGDRIGPYEILSTLGTGGMGTVYLASDVRLRRRVALKFIASDPSRSMADDAQGPLLREARAASALNHPNICQIYDVGGEGRNSWIAMEYVEGTPLDSMVKESPAGVARLGRQIAQGLAHAHARGILHRDLKSANIVCDSDGHPKILDFGIAGRLVEEVAKEVTRTATTPEPSAIAGTLPYMAPEVIRGEPQNERSDLWSLGVVLYELLTGKLPFHGRNGFDLAAAIVHGPSVQLPDSIPAPLVRVVTRLLSRDPRERYGTASEVAAALDSLSEDRAAVRAPARVATLWPVLIVVLLAAGGYVVWRLLQPPVLRITEQRLVSTAAGSHRAPSYSPDGKMLSYVAGDASGVQQIWVRDLEQGTSIQATSGTANASRPRWLPQSNQILFALAGQGIWTVPPIGGTATRLLERGSNPNVSRDGSRIVFEDRRTIWTAAPDGSDVREVKGTTPVFYGLPMAPAISPDGSTIAYFHAELGPNGDFWTIPAAGGTPRRLTSDFREGGWPVWTPDGRTIVVSSARAGSRTLWQITADGGEPSPLTAGAGEDDQPEISADGRQLAYTNVRNTWDLRVKNLATGEDRMLLQRGLELLFPMFSPDGQRLAYFGRSDYAVAIFTIGIDGSDPRPLTGGRELNHQPRWSPDGRDVFFFQAAPTVSFRRVSALGGPSTEFRRWSWDQETQACFDPTGRFIAYLRFPPRADSANVPERTVIHEVSSGRETVWNTPLRIGGWSPDGSSLVGWQRDPKDGRSMVSICRVADASCQVVTQGTAPKWSPQGNVLYFTRPAAAGGTQELWSTGIDGTGERRIADLGTFRPIDLFFDVSRDGLLAWAPIRTGDHQLWTARVK